MCSNGPKVIFLLIKTYFLEYLRSERSPAARRCACNNKYRFCNFRVLPNCVKRALIGLRERFPSQLDVVLVKYVIYFE